ncbi:MAG TPA: acetyl-CoA carboxylase biotin carboxyl carrier protein [Gammaproteobacteria bacterium]|nr:acetyl-CoA carboxylase biotin carboxyl carrier protein [Gammaproteobacteria bacterium]
MDIRKVKKLIELLEESGISEIEISEGEESVRISRYPKPGTMAPVVTTVAAAAPPAAPAAAPMAEAAQSSAPPAARGHQVTAPMVGTFYSGPAPGAKPFVEIGSEVKPGDTLCVIEAMKMMNQIESEVAGKVVSVLVENGNPVEFGQALFIIEE